MDRKTLLALALTALVVILFQVLYFAPTEREAYAKRQKALLAQKAPDSLRAESGGVSDTAGLAAPSSTEIEAAAEGAGGETQGQPPGPGAPPVGSFVNVTGATLQELKVETDLYEATFSSRGGTLTGMKLKRFPAGKGEPVNLVRDVQKGEIGLIIKSQKGHLDLNSTVFSVSDSVDAKTGRISKLTFLAIDKSGASVRKTFGFRDGSYVIGLDIELRGISSQQEKLECLVGWSGGLSLTETNMKEELRNISTVSLLGTELFQDHLGSFKKAASKEHSGNVNVKWTAVRSRYFIAAFIPPEGSVSKVISFGVPQDTLSGTRLVVPVSASGVTQTAIMLYLGPIDLWKLKELGVGLERIVNMGWSWIRPVSQVILWFLVECHKVLPNYGLVVILLSALTKIVFWPLTRSSTKSMREMQKLQPEIQKLREKFKKDPQRLNKEIMGLYKKHKVNPLGGCLPLLLQMPVFIALYNVLMSAIEMRKANFVWWINDLSSADTVAVVSGFSIHMLPLIMGISMFWQQKMTPTDPRQAAMTYFMPILMVLFFYSLPSGLVLYWTANNFMTIAQQYIMQKGEKGKQAVEPVADEKETQASKLSA